MTIINSMPVGTSTTRLVTGTIIQPALEKHYSVEEISKLWGFSDKTVKKIFADEQGVLRIGRPGSSTRRGYETLRIPESVMVRVHARLR